MPFSPLSNSTFLDYAGYGIADPSQTVVEAYGITDARPFDGNTDYGINVALVLPRVTDPTSMLAGDWASRQATIESLNATNSLWTTYGADQAQYTTTVDFLRDTLGLTVLDGNNSNYISSAESRTIWVAINTQHDFHELFGADKTLMYSPGGVGQGSEFWFWEGELTLRSEITAVGLWFDQNTVPKASNMAPGVSFTLPEGPQSIGNMGPEPSTEPQRVADLYDFPLVGADYDTGMIGLIEPANGTYLSAEDPTGTYFQHRLTEYLAGVHTGGTGSVFVQGANGQNEASNERSLDVGIAAAVNPNSDLALYNGSGDTMAVGNANASVYTAYQSAIWGTASNYDNTRTVGPAPVTSSSYKDIQSMAPGSPFYEAYAQLYVDAALMNQTTLSSSGDGGSSNRIANGVENVRTNATSLYNIMVGGTSLSKVHEASRDPTLHNGGANSLFDLAMAGDPQTIWTLVGGGLSQMPDDSERDDWLVETVWNQYETNSDQTFTGGNGSTGHSYYASNATSGGVDTTQPTPSYQVDFGLTSAAFSALNLAGRGVPDVAAPAGGNLWYTTPIADMTGQTGEGGTSSAVPFWAGLITQINYVFKDQGLRNLGYMTDLLYIAAVIAPGAFNDITMGNNVSSFTTGGADYGGINPTGYGHAAHTGYDLVTGLGSPDGLLLARALSQIAHQQTFFAAVPDVIESDNAGGWTSGTAQTLLLQTTATAASSVAVHTGADTSSFESAAHGAFAWTSLFAQKSLQADFDPAIVLLFDGQAQGTLTQTAMVAGESLSVDFDGSGTVAAQANLSSSFGFADFFADGANYLRVAQTVAVAETANGADDVAAVIRVRQVGKDSLSVKFYQVDDYNGTIGGVAPGEAGYAAAAETRLYSLQSAGGTSLGGPGFGNFTQDQLLGVDAGDLIAMELVNATKGVAFWAFSPSNETVNGTPVPHLWNYGANTWGWEDLPGGGDWDFNDLVVQFDFTSTAGQGLLVA